MLNEFHEHLVNLSHALAIGTKLLSWLGGIFFDELGPIYLASIVLCFIDQPGILEMDDCPLHYLQVLKNLLVISFGQLCHLIVAIFNRY